MPKITAKDFNNRIFIKVVAWITILSSSILAYYSLFTFIQLILFEHQMVSQISVFDTAQIISFGMLFFALFILISGLGLLKCKNWARITWSIISTLISLSLVSGSIYLSFTYHKQKNEMGIWAGLNLFQTVQFLGYSLLALIIAWALVKATIKLNRKDLKIHFDKKLGW